MKGFSINGVHKSMHTLNDVKARKREFMMQEFWSQIKGELASQGN